MAILELENISKLYRKGESEVTALGGVNLSIEKGEFLAIVGPSGSGKTTMLNIIGCLDSPTEGKVFYNGEEMRARDETALSDYRKSHISFIFQSYNLIPVLTVRENVELPLVIEKKLAAKAIRDKAMAMIEAVGLSGMANRYPRELSGGQEQRVAIARALVKDPFIVLADEPTANLDSVTAHEIMDLMKRINERSRATFLFSTHDKLVMEYAYRIVELHDGLVAADKQRTKS